MSDTNTAVYTLLSGIPALFAYCDDRIYPAVLPQGATYPAVRFSKDDDGGFKDLDGQGGTIQTSLQIDFIAATLTDATAMAAAVAAALKNYSGVFGTRYITTMFLESEFDTYESSLDGGVYRASQAWRFWHY